MEIAIERVLARVVLVVGLAHLFAVQRFHRQGVVKHEYSAVRLGDHRHYPRILGPSGQRHRVFGASQEAMGEDDRDNVHDDDDHDVEVPVEPVRQEVRVHLESVVMTAWDGETSRPNSA